MKSDLAYEALHMAVLWYGAGMLPRLRQMTSDERLKMLQQADKLNMHEPLHMHPARDLEVPLWSEQKLSGGQVIALIVFGLWVQCGEKEDVAGALLDEWPETRMAMTLCQQECDARV